MDRDDVAVLSGQERRRRAVDNARHSTAIEGGAPDPAGAELQERYVMGELTLEQLGEEIRALIRRGE